MKKFTLQELLQLNNDQLIKIILEQDIAIERLTQQLVIEMTSQVSNDFDILVFAEEEAKEITRQILREYDKLSFETEAGEVLENIYDRALRISTGYFIKNKDIVNKSMITSLKDYLKITLEDPNAVKRLTEEELLANTINSYVIKCLLDWEGIIL